METKKDEPFSLYAKFHFALEGFDIWSNGQKFNRWEVFASGITNAELLFNNKTIYELLPKEDVFGEVA
ncbi:hypothetical protein ACFQ5N_02345 [Lutibacter holmesii]|uniref:Uncharacterized protein n=1 Tax=Lutibacter holmesii TaxID=1137985 RepID=A0ABW3WKR1_9FLAO